QEFQMLEWYCAYENFEHGMQWTEKILKYSVPKALGRSIFTVYDQKGNKCEVNINCKYHRIKFSKLLSEYGIDMFAPKDKLVALAMQNGIKKEEAEKRSQGNLIDDIYKKLILPNIIQPTFITHYPSDLLPLARPNDSQPELADSYQLVIASREIAKGYSELTDPIIQRKALEEQARAREMGDDEAMAVNEEYLAAMEHGMPPITGCGIGIDRLVALINGQKNMRDCVFFPLLKPDKGYEYI
ncbi:MAG TPA: lysine--tRNA ligase, partial [Candidatus Moranbacteria bacterium]|nr:lysine--tRNA ligase [Candidatus Moranbacteria bacterium]